MKSFYKLFYLLLIFFLSIGNLYFFKLSNIGVYDIPVTFFILFSSFALIFYIIEILQKGNLVINKINFNVLFFLSIIIVLNIQNSRITTILYFYFYFLVYILIFEFVKRMQINDFVRILKLVIVSYFIVIFISFIMYFFSKSLLDLILPFAYSYTKGSLRFFGLALEPSHAAFVVLTSYYVLNIFNKDIFHKKTNIFYHILVFLMIVLMKSGYGFLLYGMIFFHYLFIHKKYISMLILGAVIFIFNFLFNIFSSLRIYGLIDFIFLKKFDAIDPSGFIRIMPTINYFSNIDFLNINTYIGNGLGSSTAYFYKLYSYLTDATTFSAFFAEILYDLGIIGLLILLVFYYNNLCKKHRIISFIIIILLLFNSGINTQVYWWVIVLLFSIKIFIKKYDNIQLRIS